MSIKAFILGCLALGTLGTYLFVSAPPPLEVEERTRRIPIERALAILNEQNEEARALYAAEIVGAGKLRGFEFDENWKRKDVHAGPLPALFLRETAASLQGSKTRLGLFLGSDRAINGSNAFTGAQIERFERIKKTRAPEVFFSEDTALFVGMFPDVASSAACVDCHNEHPDSPKKDWRLGDIMGATTWSHPSSHVSLEEVLEMSTALLSGIERSYGLVLDELSRLPRRPRIATQWPRDGYYVPNAETFMKEVRARTAPRLVEALSAELRRYDATGK